MINRHTPKQHENATEGLTCALRKELLEHAGLLELLQRQQALIFEENLWELIKISDEISLQQQIIKSSRHTRTYWQKRTIQEMYEEDDLSWDEMAHRLPEHHQVPLQLIRIEINLSPVEQLACSINYAAAASVTSPWMARVADS